jgi:hypothetical protein
MKKTTKQALIARYEEQLFHLNELIDLNFHNEEAVKQFQKQYKHTAKVLAELVKTKTDDE